MNVPYYIVAGYNDNGQQISAVSVNDELLKLGRLDDAEFEAWCVNLEENDAPTGLSWSVYYVSTTEDEARVYRECGLI